MREGGGAKESHGDALFRTKNQSKTSFFVCEWLLQDCRPTNHVMTPLASPRAKARTHLGAATCLDLLMLLHRGDGCINLAVLDLLVLVSERHPSYRRPCGLRLRRGYGSTGGKGRQRTGRTNGQVTHRWSQSSLVDSPRASMSAPKTSNGNNERARSRSGECIFGWLQVAGGCRAW